MPALNNSKHELFAQAMAQGMTQEAAWRAAGYRCTVGTARVNANRALKNADIQARIAELQGKAANKVGVTLEWLLNECQEIVKEARAAEDYAAASQTIERAAKIAGLWVDRAETKAQVESYTLNAPAPAASIDEWQTEARH